MMICSEKDPAIIYSEDCYGRRFMHFRLECGSYGEGIPVREKPCPCCGKKSCHGYS